MAGAAEVGRFLQEEEALMLFTSLKELKMSQLDLRTQGLTKIQREEEVEA